MKVKLIATGILLGIISSVFAARVPLADIQARKDGKKAVTDNKPLTGVSWYVIVIFFAG